MLPHPPSLAGYKQPASVRMCSPFKKFLDPPLVAMAEWSGTWWRKESNQSDWQFQCGFLALSSHDITIHRPARLEWVSKRNVIASLLFIEMQPSGVCVVGTFIVDSTWGKRMYNHFCMHSNINCANSNCNCSDRIGWGSHCVLKCSGHFSHWCAEPWTTVCVRVYNNNWILSGHMQKNC